MPFLQNIPKTTLRLFVGIIGILTCAQCSPPQEAEQEIELEQHIYPLPLRLEDKNVKPGIIETKYAKSGILIEYTFKKYDLSIEQFNNQPSELSKEERTFKEFFLENGFGNKHDHIIGFISTGDRMSFVVETKMANGKKGIYFPSFRRKDNTEIEILGQLIFYQALALSSFKQSWLQPSQYSVLPREFVKSQDPRMFHYVVKTPTIEKKTFLNIHGEISYFLFQGTAFLLRYHG